MLQGNDPRRLCRTVVGVKKHRQGIHIRNKMLSDYPDFLYYLNQGFPVTIYICRRLTVFFRSTGRLRPGPVSAPELATLEQAADSRIVQRHPEQPFRRRCLYFPYGIPPRCHYG